MPTGEKRICTVQTLVAQGSAVLCGGHSGCLGAPKRDSWKLPRGNESRSEGRAVTKYKGRMEGERGGRGTARAETRGRVRGQDEERLEPAFPGTGATQLVLAGVPPSRLVRCTLFQRGSHGVLSLHSGDTLSSDGERPRLIFFFLFTAAPATYGSSWAPGSNQSCSWALHSKTGPGAHL